MLPLSYKDKDYARSPLAVLQSTLGRWLSTIVSSRNSRNLFGFLLINLSFAFVELGYGMATNSLSLISDAFHMFFDCTGLIVGLVAAIITRREANSQYSYGYLRAEIIGGFINALFLLFVAFFIFAEAVERAFEPPEVKHERLLLVSVLGLIVNLIGIFAFQHGGATCHGHSHNADQSATCHTAGGGACHIGMGEACHTAGGGACRHTVSGVDTHPAASQSWHMDCSAAAAPHDSSACTHLLYNEQTPHTTCHHQHHHQDTSVSDFSAHSSDRQIMRGILLHIIADTLGSVGVIVSALFMSTFGWMLADPLCSMFIALTIGWSVLPLLRDSLAVLMQRQPRQLDAVLPSLCRQAACLDGVVGVYDCHCWTLCSDCYVGAVRVQVRPQTDCRRVLQAVQSLFRSCSVKHLHVQIEYAQV